MELAIRDGSGQGGGGGGGGRGGAEGEHKEAAHAQVEIAAADECKAPGGAPSEDELQRLAKDASIPVDEVLARLGVRRETGLSEAEAAQRLASYGANELDREKKLSLLELFLLQFANVVIILLVVASIVSIAVGEWVEGVAILIIVFINATIATVTERSSNNALEALARLSNPHAVVVRGGHTRQILTSELVPGDVVVLNSGDLVPADMRVVDSKDLKTNEMVLTGESQDVNKSAALPREEGKERLTPPNMVFASTNAVEGSCTAVVLLTGMRTRVGAIAKLLKEAGQTPLPGRSASGGDEDDDESRSCLRTAWRGLQQWYERVRPKRTPLQEQLHNVGVVMAGVAISVATLVLIIGVVRGERDPSKPENAPWLQFLMLSVSIAVSAIPEGLPLVVTICLALGTTSMAEHHALIRKLPAVETLGSASVVCSDKTGTLTTGKMTAVAAWCAGVHYTITGAGLAPEGHFFLGHGNAGKQLQLADASARGLVTTLLVAGSCSNARIAFRAEDKMWVAFGSSTEAAIVVAAAKLGLAAEALEKIMPRVDEVAFNSSRKMMTTVHQLRDAELKHAPAPVAAALTALAGAHHALVFAKGAPNVLIERCSHVQSPSGDTGMLNEAARGHIMESVDAMSSQGLRVLACAYRPLSAPLEGQAEMTAEQKHERLPRDMVFCGLIGIMDPPREGVANSVARARGAGVRTVMITGDYVKTAVAIARMVGILDPTADSVDSSVDCSALRPEGVYLSDPDIDAITRRVNVFARARPEDKIYVVRSFQRQGLVCAMTGDGVNDAPALKQADIGVAMGLAGSEVAKSAGDMILTDDDFTSIINAVERGRTIYANIQKFVMYLIGTNWAQLIVVFSCVVAGLPAPLEPLQILFINLATDGMPAVALSVEAPEDNIMRMPPRRRREPIIHRRLAINTAVHAVTLAALMVLIFALGLYWHIGDVLITNMFVSEKELISTCRKLRGDSSFKTINDEDCVETGLRQARTMVFLTLALSENMRPLTVRNFQDSLFHRLFDNKHMLRAVSASTALVMFVTFTPGVQDVFSLTEIEWWDWLLVLLAVIITVVVDEANKSNLRTAAKERRRWNRLFGMLESISLDIRTVQHHVSRDPAAKTPAPDLPGLRRLSRAFNELVDRYEFDEKSTTKAD